jgi:hypothetical protein
MRKWLDRPPTREWRTEMNGFHHMIKLIAANAKRLEDRQNGWEYEEERRLAIRPDALEEETVIAEVHREPTFGFGTRPEKIIVRLHLNTNGAVRNTLCQQWEVAVTLYEGSQPFGTEGSWTATSVEVDNDTDEICAIWLES